MTGASGPGLDGRPSSGSRNIGRPFARDCEAGLGDRRPNRRLGTQVVERAGASFPSRL